VDADGADVVGYPSFRYIQIAVMVTSRITPDFGRELEGGVPGWVGPVSIREQSSKSECQEYGSSP
jgi:hypothetical protein